VQVVPGEFGVADAGVPGQRLLGLPVRVRGIELGRPVDLLVDPNQGRVLGLDVLCGDDRHRFLPLPTAIVAEDELVVPSALVLVDDEDAGFYRHRTFRLSSLRNLPVEQNEQQIGRLHDLLLEADGRIAALIVDGDDGRMSVPYTRLQLGGGILRC